MQIVESGLLGKWYSNYFAPPEEKCLGNTNSEAKSVGLHGLQASLYIIKYSNKNVNSNSEILVG